MRELNASHYAPYSLDLQSFATEAEMVAATDGPNRNLTLWGGMPVWCGVVWCGVVWCGVGVILDSAISILSR
jgi:hypothetical protein